MSRTSLTPAEDPAGISMADVLTLSAHSQRWCQPFGHDSTVRDDDLARVVGGSLTYFQLGVNWGPQPGDIVCEAYDPCLGDCVVESVYPGQ